MLIIWTRILVGFNQKIISVNSNIFFRIRASFSKNIVYENREIYKYKYHIL